MNFATLINGNYPCTGTLINRPVHAGPADLWPAFRKQEMYVMAKDIIFPLNDDEEEINNGAGEPIYKLAVCHFGPARPDGRKTGRIITLFSPQIPLHHETQQDHYSRSGRVRVCVDFQQMLTTRPA